METRAYSGRRGGAVVRWWRRLPISGQDAFLAGVWFLAFVPLGSLGWYSPFRWWLLLAVLAICLPLVWRRRYPFTVGLATGVLVILYQTLLGVTDMLHVGLAAFVAGSAVFHGSRLLVVAPLSSAWFMAFYYVYTHGLMSEHGVLQHAMLAVMGALPAIIGYLLRLRAESTEQRIRATRARAQQERARERARIARDVHDIAGHHLSSIRLLAVGGRESLKGADADPDTVLASIADASGRAVREVRELLDLLRNDRLDEPAPSDVRLDDIPLLVPSLDGTGVEVDLVIPYGVSDGVPARVEADAYRIVQESLGNVLRHSSARHVVVRLALRNSGSDRLRHLMVTVEDDGSPLSEGIVLHSTGTGLRGMQERAEELGGSLEAGFRPGSGWRVRAFLPFAGVQQGSAAPEEENRSAEPSEPVPPGEAGDRGPAEPGRVASGGIRKDTERGGSGP